MKINQTQRPSIHTFLNHTDLGQTSESILEMIMLLKQQEMLCQKSQDFQAAEEAKNKIEFLKNQDFLIRKERFEEEDKENMQQVSDRGDHDVREFEAKWDEHLEQVIDTLKQSEMGLIQQHEGELMEIQQILKLEQSPKIKFSVHVLEMRNHMKNVIKVRDYKEAEQVKTALERRQQKEEIKWQQTYQTRKCGKVKLVRKKQEGELKALRVKLETIFNQQMSERNSQFQTS